MNDKCERCYPWVVGILFGIGLVACVCIWDLVLPKTIKELFTGAMTISSITVGFLATAKSIVFSIQDKQVIQDLKKSNEYNKLIDYLMSGINWSLIVAVVSGAALMIDFENMSKVHSIFLGAWVCVSTAAVFAYYRVIRLFSRILRDKEKPIEIPKTPATQESDGSGSLVAE